MSKAEKLEKLTKHITKIDSTRDRIEQSYTKYKNIVLGEFSKFK